MLRADTSICRSGRCLTWVVIGFALTMCGIVNGQSLAELQAAAKKRDPAAQYQLGRRYLLGIGIGADEKEGFRFLKQAADQNHAEAAHLVAVCYATEAGIKKNDRETVKYFDKAANAGLAEAQYKLAVVYETGLSSVKPDPNIAMKWYLNAAKQGHARAQYKYAELMHKTDYNVSAEWYRKAAEQGVVEAQIKVGDLYSLGQAVGGRDFSEAYKWYVIASRLGNSLALKKVAGAKNSPTYYSEKVIAEGIRRAEAHLQQNSAFAKAP